MEDVNVRNSGVKGFNVLQYNTKRKIMPPVKFEDNHNYTDPNQ